MCSVTIYMFPTVTDFPIKIQGFKTKNLFNTGAQVSCISSECYREFKLKTKIEMNVRATVSSANQSNLGPIRNATCSLLLGAHKFENKFIVCKHLLHHVILGLDFAQDFKVGIDWNHQGHLYLNQDHKPLPYSKLSPSKDPKTFSVEYDEARLIGRTNILILPQAIVAALAKGTNRLYISGVKDKAANVIANLFLCNKSLFKLSHRLSLL